MGQPPTTPYAAPKPEKNEVKTQCLPISLQENDNKAPCRTCTLLINRLQKVGRPKKRSKLPKEFCFGLTVNVSLQLLGPRADMTSSIRSEFYEKCRFVSLSFRTPFPWFWAYIILYQKHIPLTLLAWPLIKRSLLASFQSESLKQTTVQLLLIPAAAPKTFKTNVSSWKSDVFTELAQL